MIAVWVLLALGAHLTVAVRVTRVFAQIDLTGDEYGDAVLGLLWPLSVPILALSGLPWVVARLARRR